MSELTPDEKRSRARELDDEAAALMRRANELKYIAGCLLIEAAAESGGAGRCECADFGHRSSEHSRYCLCGGLMDA